MTRRDVVAQLLVVAVAIVGASFVFFPGMLHGHDMEMHLFRLQALDHEIQNGVLYPRWVDDFVFGYGYPVFLFYSPLTYYLGEAFHLVGLTFVDSFKIVSVLARVVGGLGTYYLGRDTMRSRPAGLLAAIAFLLASYQFTDLSERVAIPELIEMNLMPATLWAVTRVVARRTARNIAFAGVLVALLVLGHQTTALTSAVLLGAFGGFLLARTWLAGKEFGDARIALISLASVATIGVLLSAFFWLPAWVVHGDVPLESMPPGMLPFSDELTNLPDLIQRSVFYVYPFPSF
ncbi:MAG TPA: 6-pyruvoyl-tetrahydropterin synthase-related protein, partial [Chloroflexota bacterium]|nr:6-pyruvoyl-tetrahydropterin synthase-related protein [Chloroflexota bacterium]